MQELKFSHVKLVAQRYSLDCSIVTHQVFRCFNLPLATVRQPIFSPALYCTYIVCRFFVYCLLLFFFLFLMLLREKGARLYKNSLSFKNTIWYKYHVFFPFSLNVLLRPMACCRCILQCHFFHNFWGLEQIPSL